MTPAEQIEERARKLYETWCQLPWIAVARLSFKFERDAAKHVVLGAMCAGEDSDSTADFEARQIQYEAGIDAKYAGLLPEKSK